MAGPLKIDDRIVEFMDSSILTQPRKKVENRARSAGIPAGARRVPRRTERKYLQIDELIEYALQHSDLFYPSRAERVMSFAETAQG